MRRRLGMNLVELLVVAALIGILAATIFLAVQSARESVLAVRVTLSQIGLALKLFPEVHQQFPPGYISNVNPLSSLIVRLTPLGSGLQKRATTITLDDHCCNTSILMAYRKSCRRNPRPVSMPMRRPTRRHAGTDDNRFGNGWQWWIGDGGRRDLWQRIAMHQAMCVIITAAIRHSVKYIVVHIIRDDGYASIA